MPPIVVALSFGLAAMAPVAAVALLVVASMPAWRALALRGLIVALAAGVAGFLLLFVVFPAQPVRLVSGLVAFGAGFSSGVAVICLWAIVVREKRSGPTVETGAKASPPSQS